LLTRGLLFLAQIAFMEDKPAPLKGFIEQQLDEAALKQKVYAETKTAFASEDRFVNYLNGFDENSVKQFTEYYAHMKGQWMASGPMMTKYRSFQRNQWWKYAFECLEHIQHKKLLNLECRWRAEEIKVEGFEICFDFRLYGKEVLDCKAIPAVSSEELDAYIQYLEELSDEERFLRQWNIGDDYERAKNNFYGIDTDGVYPEWYRFYDRHFGTEVLLTLPDIRGKKEKFYWDLWYKEKAPEYAAHEAARDKRPHMKYLSDREFAEWFLKTFDAKETLPLYRAVRGYDDIREQTEEIEMDLINLQQAKQQEPIENDEDWRNGVKRATEMYHRKKTIAQLPSAWEVYRQRIEEGKPAQEKEDRQHAKDNSTMHDLRPMYLEHLLRGRELNGEPRDLNF
jgi:hypothetical protein